MKPGPPCRQGLGVTVAAFLLIIKHSLETAGDDFGAAEARRFEAASVRVGRSPDCECTLDSEDLGSVQFTICRAAEGAEGWRLLPGPDLANPLFLNREPVSATAPLRSGDEIRVAHWVFCFQKLHPPAAQGRRADLVAAAAKVLICVIFLAEILIVSWLPRQVRSVHQLELQVLRGRTVLLLDGLRDELRAYRPTGDLDKAARQLLLTELDSLVRYIRPHEEALSREQWRRICEDLREYEKITARLIAGTAFCPVPDIDVEAAVRAVLRPTTTEGIAPP